MENLNAEQAIEILEKFDLFQGQRAGRELWKDKPFDVQEQDIANFSRDVDFLKNYIKKLTDDNAWCAKRIIEADKKNKELTEENKNLTINMNAYGLTAKRLAEENERLKHELEKADKNFGDFCRHAKKVVKRTAADTLWEYGKQVYQLILGCFGDKLSEQNIDFITVSLGQFAKDLLEGEISLYEGENDARINKWMNLVFEEAKIRAKREYDRRCVECNYKYSEADMSKLIAEAKSEAIIKMHSLIKERCIAGGIYPAFVESTIEKVAKEMLAGEK